MISQTFDLICYESKAVGNYNSTWNRFLLGNYNGNFLYDMFKLQWKVQDLPWIKKKLNATKEHRSDAKSFKSFTLIKNFCLHKIIKVLLIVFGEFCEVIIVSSCCASAAVFALCEWESEFIKSKHGFRFRCFLSTKLHLHFCHAFTVRRRTNALRQRTNLKKLYHFIIFFFLPLLYNYNE